MLAVGSEKSKALARAGERESMNDSIGYVTGHKKNHTLSDVAFLKYKPGGVLLSHGETPHYHRR